MCVVVVGKETYDVVFVKVYMWLTKKTKKKNRVSLFLCLKMKVGGGACRARRSSLSHTNIIKSIMGGGWNNGQFEPHWFAPKPVVISTTP